MCNKCGSTKKSCCGGSNKSRCNPCGSNNPCGSSKSCSSSKITCSTCTQSKTCTSCSGNNPHIHPYMKPKDQMFYGWRTECQEQTKKSCKCWTSEWVNNVVSSCDECDKSYLCKSTDLRIKLANINDDCNRSEPQVKENPEEKKYRNKNYNGSFHKPLQHVDDTGKLEDSTEYNQMVCAILSNDQNSLNALPLADGSQVKLVDPLASLAGVLLGADPCSKCVNLDPPYGLSSNEMAAEMIELYGMKLTRDVWFGDFGTDSTVANVVSYLQPVKSYLPDLAPANTLTTSNVFRGNTAGELVGPYISQLFLLNVPQGAMTAQQIYTSPPSVSTAQSGGYTVEWGRNNLEMIQIENGNISSLPAGPTSVDNVNHYINNGRVLAEAVHVDPAFHIMYSASLILLGLGASPNPGIPALPNQSNFPTNGGGPSFQCALAGVAEYALRHAWYWKWQVYRKLRPEVVSLWVDNVKNSRVPNASNYDISSLLLNSSILPDIEAANGSWGSGFANSYTLAQCFKEGSPAHPAYPSGHATIGGACATIIKIFLDCEKKWSTLPGVATPNRRIIPSTVTNGVAVADSAGTSLVNYTGSDAAQIFIYGEVDKLASNIGIGRNWAGVHYRTDATRGIKLGEEIAIRYMEDVMSTWVANNVDGSTPKIQFRKFDGTLYTLTPSICQK